MFQTKEKTLTEFFDYIQLVNLINQPLNLPELHLPSFAGSNDSPSF